MNNTAEFYITYRELRALFRDPSHDLINRLQIRCLASAETEADKLEFIDGLRGVVGHLADFRTS
jgi:hypothetical protein